MGSRGTFSRPRSSSQLDPAIRTSLPCRDATLHGIFPSAPHASFDAHAACLIRVSWRFLGLAEDFVSWLMSRRCRWRMMSGVTWPTIVAGADGTGLISDCSSAIYWLGGRDSNPDNVVQRVVNGLRSGPVRSVLFQFSASALRCVPLRSAMFTPQMSLCVSGSIALQSRSRMRGSRVGLQSE
jgi:hypothetical protein